MIRLAIIGCGLSLVAACDAGTDPAEAVASLTVTPAVDSIEIGETITLDVLARDGDGTTIAPLLAFASTVPAVAGVSSEGVVTGLHLGDAIIVVSAGAVAAVAEVAVLGPPEALDLQIEGEIQVIGDSMVVRGVALDGLGRVLPAPVTLSSLDPGVVEVTGGVITAIANGEGRVQAAAGTIADTITVNVRAFTHPDGMIAATPAVSARPYGVAISRNGVVLVVRLDAAAASVDSLDGPLSFASAIDVGLVPTSVAFSSDGARAYSADQGGTISIIDAATLARIDQVPVQGSAFVVAVDSTGTVWAGSNQAWIYRIDPMTLVRDSVDVGDHVNGLAFAANRVFATDPAFGNVVAIDPITLATSTIAVGGRPQGLVAHDGLLYVAREQGNVLLIDAATRGVVDSVGVSGGFGIAVSPDGARLYVTRFASGLSIVDLEGGGITNVTPGGDLRRVAFSFLGDVAIVTDQDNRLLVIR